MKSFEATMLWLCLIVAMAVTLLTPDLAKESSGCKSVTIHNLDPRFVEQARVAAASNQETLEQWLVESSLMRSGYHLNSGFCK